MSGKRERYHQNGRQHRPSEGASPAPKIILTQLLHGGPVWEAPESFTGDGRWASFAPFQLWGLFTIGGTTR